MRLRTVEKSGECGQKIYFQLLLIVRDVEVKC